MCYSEPHKYLMLAGSVLKKHDKSIADASGCALGQVQILWLTQLQERVQEKSEAEGGSLIVELGEIGKKSKLENRKKGDDGRKIK